MLMLEPASILTLESFRRLPPIVHKGNPGFQTQNRPPELGWYLDTPAPLRWILEPELPLSPDVLAIPGGDPAIGSEGQPAVAQNRPLSSLTGWKSHMEVAAARLGAARSLVLGPLPELPQVLPTPRRSGSVADVGRHVGRETL